MAKSVFDFLSPVIGLATGGPAGGLFGSLGSSFGGKLLGGAASSLGSGLVSSIFDGGSHHDNSGPSAPAPYVPQQDQAMGLPQSLSQFSGFSPQQQSSNIATQGVYGGGEGPEENKYFLNQINRRLVDQTGTLGSTDSINPVENSFLSTLGLGGYKDTNDLLTKIHGYKG